MIIAFALMFNGKPARQPLQRDWPEYQSTISKKMSVISDTTTGRGTLERASGMLKDLSKENQQAEGAGNQRKPESNAAQTHSRGSPQPQPGALQSLQSLISPLLHPLATTGIIVIFVIFILLHVRKSNPIGST